MITLFLLASVELIADGNPRVRVETDGSGPAVYAAELLRAEVVRLTGVALPATGKLPVLRIRSSGAQGYSIRLEGDGLVIEGRDPVRAVADLRAKWRRAEAPPEGRLARLTIAARVWLPERRLWRESTEFDPWFPCAGLAAPGLPPKEAIAALKRAGYTLRISAKSFSEFLPTTHFERHPEWFALRAGKREARGNFALTNAEARRAYLDGLGAWLAAHPEVDVIGIWPEVTSVWCEESLAIGAPSAYALLWREAAARFPDRRFEILATGLTLRPPAGPVPPNVEVRFRAGHDASALQGIAGQPAETIVEAWEARGASVVLEIDAAPESWCGMPWPCEDAIRANAKRFRLAVLRHGTSGQARTWDDPVPAPAEPNAIAQRARSVKSWGHPRDAAYLFLEPGQGIAFKIGATERLWRIAENDRDAGAAADVYRGYLSILSDLAPRHAATYRRYRARDLRRLVEDLLPDGVERRVGPAKVRETFDHLVVETDLLRIAIDRRRARVQSLERFVRGKWSEELSTGAFEVVALAVKSARTEGSVGLSSPSVGRLRIDLKGRLRPDGPRWRSRLDLASGSGVVTQTAEVEAAGGIALGCTFVRGRFDRWVCPPHAIEGRLGKTSPTLRLPPGTLVYCRGGEDGIGIAARLRHGGRALVEDGIVAIGPARTLMVDWIVFVGLPELAAKQ